MIETLSSVVIVVLAVTRPTLLPAEKMNRVSLIFLQKKATGQELLEHVFFHLDLVEKDYFGLQYTDPYNVPHWLDPSKPVKKQVKSK